MKKAVQLNEQLNKMNKTKIVNGENFEDIQAGDKLALFDGDQRREAILVEWLDAETENSTDSEDPNEVILLFKDTNNGEEIAAVFNQTKNQFVFEDSGNPVRIREQPDVVADDPDELINSIDLI